MDYLALISNAISACAGAFFGALAAYCVACFVLSSNDCVKISQRYSTDFKFARKIFCEGMIKTFYQTPIKKTFPPR